MLGKFERCQATCLIFTVIFYGQPYEGMQIHQNMAKTRKLNLLRHKSGRYYARAFAGSKEVWKSLKTTHYGVAEAKLAEFLKEHRERVRNGNGEHSIAQSAARYIRASRDKADRCDRIPAQRITDATHG